MAGANHPGQAAQAWESWGLQLSFWSRNGIFLSSPAWAKSGVCVLQDPENIHLESVSGPLGRTTFPYFVFIGSWMCLFILLWKAYFVPGRVCEEKEL